MEEEKVLSPSTRRGKNLQAMLGGDIKPPTVVTKIRKGIWSSIGFSFTLISLLCPDKNYEARFAVSQRGYRLIPLSAEEMTQLDSNSSGAVSDVSQFAPSPSIFERIPPTDLQNRLSSLPDVSKPRYSDDLSASRDASDQTLHLMFEVKQLMFTCGEPLEVFYSLWSIDTNQFITEDFCVTMTANGFPDNYTTVPDQRCIFIDIPRELFGSPEPGARFTGLRVVCQIFRSGDLVKKDATPAKKPGLFSSLGVSSSSPSVPSQRFRRPAAVAVCDVPFGTIISKIGEEHSSSAKIYDLRDDSDIVTAHQRIIMSPFVFLMQSQLFCEPLMLFSLPSSEQCQEIKNSMGIAFSLYLFNSLQTVSGNLAPDLAKNPAQESILAPTAPFDRKASVALVPRCDRSYEYPESPAAPLSQGLPHSEFARHGFTFTLLEGDFLQGRKTSEKNVLVRVQLRNNSDGHPLAGGSFHHGFGSLAKPTPDAYSSLFYHCNRPKWNDRWIAELPVASQRFFEWRTALKTSLILFLFPRHRD